MVEDPTITSPCAAESAERESDPPTDRPMYTRVKIGNNPTYAVSPCSVSSKKIESESETASNTNVTVNNSNNKDTVTNTNDKNKVENSNEVQSKETSVPQPSQNVSK